MLLMPLILHSLVGVMVISRQQSKMRSSTNYRASYNTLRHAGIMPFSHMKPITHGPSGMLLASSSKCYLCARLKYLHTSSAHSCRHGGRQPGMRALRRGARLVVLRALLRELPERRRLPDVLDDEQRHCARRPAVCDAGLQLHTGRRPCGAPGPRRFQDAEPASDKGRPEVDARRRGRLRRDAVLLPPPQARHRHLRGHRRLARLFSPEDQHAQPRGIRDQRQRQPRRDPGSGQKDRPPDFHHPRGGRALLRGGGPFPGGGPADGGGPEREGVHPPDEERPPPRRLDRHRPGVASRLPPPDRPPAHHQRKQPRRHRGPAQERPHGPAWAGESLPAEANPTAATRRALLRAQAFLAGESPEVRLFYERSALAPDAGGPGADYSI